MIFPFIADGCFDPEATKIMGDVFDEMIWSLDQFGRPRIIQEAVARHVIKAVRGRARPRRHLSTGARGDVVAARPRRGKPRERRPRTGRNRGFRRLTG